MHGDDSGSCLFIWHAPLSRLRGDAGELGSCIHAQVQLHLLQKPLDRVLCIVPLPCPSLQHCSVLSGNVRGLTSCEGLLHQQYACRQGIIPLILRMDWRHNSQRRSLALSDLGMQPLGLYSVLQETRPTWLRKSCVTRCSHSVSGLPSERRPEMPPWVVLWMYSGGARPPAHAPQNQGIC